MSDLSFAKSGSASRRRSEHSLKTLPASYYTDSDFFRREIEAFFFEDWICAGRADNVPNVGDYFLREVAGESIIVVRTGTDSIRAFFNVCRHRGTRLCEAAEGHFAGRIQCPYHGWTYGLNGQLIGAPHMDASTFKHAEYPLHELCTEIWDGHISSQRSGESLAATAPAPDLPTRFAPWRMEDLRLHKRIDYLVRANWKLVVANYNECLHCPLLHPRSTG